MIIEFKFNDLDLINKIQWPTMACMSSIALIKTKINKKSLSSKSIIRKCSSIYIYLYIYIYNCFLIHGSLAIRRTTTSKQRKIDQENPILQNSKELSNYNDFL